MNKQEFLAQLGARLSGLPKQEVEERLRFYGEMIDDRMEDGLSEQEAVRDIGSVDDIVSQILSEIPLAKLAKEKIRPKRKLRAWEIVLIAVGSPIWFSLLIAAFAVILSLYIVLWSVIIAFWSVFVSFAACAPVGILMGVVYICGGNGLAGIFIISCGLTLAGLAIFAFFGCMEATKGTLLLTKKIALGIKRRMIKKEELS